MKTLLYSIILNLIVMSCLAHSQEKPSIVLLTSLDNSEYTRAAWRDNSWNISEKIEYIFRQRFQDSGYNLIVIHHANQYHLWQHTKSPNVIGIFWISHAAPGGGNNRGISRSNLIVDYQGNNVAEIFKKIHPNIRWISILGCQTYGILIDQFKNQGLYKNNPDLIIDSSKENISSILEELNRSITKSSKVLSSNPIEVSRSFYRHISKTNNIFRLRKLGFDSLPYNYGNFLIHQNSVSISSLEDFKTIDISKMIKTAYYITIKREIPFKVALKDIRAVRIQLAGKTVAVFPKGNPGECQTLKVYLDSSETLNDLSMMMDTGANFMSDRDVIIGKFNFSTSWTHKKRWVLFSDDDGNPIGVRYHLYLHQ